MDNEAPDRGYWERVLAFAERKLNNIDQLPASGVELESDADNPATTSATIEDGLTDAERVQLGIDNSQAMGIEPELQPIARTHEGRNTSGRSNG